MKRRQMSNPTDGYKKSTVLYMKIIKTTFHINSCCTQGRLCDSEDAALNSLAVGRIDLLQHSLLHRLSLELKELPESPHVMKRV